MLEKDGELKLKIKASCIDCSFSGNYDEVYDHCKNEKHGGYGSYVLWGDSGRNRCNMSLDQDDTVRAIILTSLSDVIEDLFDYDENVYKNFLEFWYDMYACEKISYKIEGDDIYDVITNYPTSKLKQMIISQLKKIEIE